MPKRVKLEDGRILNFGDDVSEVEMRDAVEALVSAPKRSPSVDDLNSPRFSTPSLPSGALEEAQAVNLGTQEIMAQNQKPISDPLPEMLSRGMDIARQGARTLSGNAIAGQTMEPILPSRNDLQRLREKASPILGPTELQAEAAAQGGMPQPEGLIPSLSKPIIPAPRIPQQEGTVAQIGAGAANALIGAAEFFESPLGVATFGAAFAPKLAQKAIGAAFTVDMARQLPAQGKEAGRLSVEGTPQEKTQAFTGLGLTAAMAAAPLAHEVIGGKRAVERADAEARAKPVDLNQTEALPPRRPEDVVVVPREPLTAPEAKSAPEPVVAPKEVAPVEALPKDVVELVKSDPEIAKIEEAIKRESVLIEDADAIEAALDKRGVKPIVDEIQPKVAAEPSKPAEVAAEAAIPLGLERPSIRDKSMEVLSDIEFDAEYKRIKKSINEIEKKYDERPDLFEGNSKERTALAKIQDEFDSAQLERFRRNIRDTVPEDLMRELKDAAGKAVDFGKGSIQYQKALLLMEEIKRQGASDAELLSGIRLSSPDAAEVFKADLKDIKQIAQDSISQLLQKGIDATNVDFRNLQEGVTGAPVWMTKAAANGALRVIKVTYEATRDAAKAIQNAIIWLRSQKIKDFNEAEAKAFLESSLKESKAEKAPESASPVAVPESQSNAWLPDFDPYAESVAKNTEPFGMELAPVVGKIFGPRGKRVLSPVDKAVVNYAAEYQGRGKAIASAIGSTLSGKIDPVFKPDAEGNLNVGKAKDGQSLKVADVFEELQRDPNSYVLTPDQRKVFNEVLMPLDRARRELVKKYDLVGIEDADGNQLSYFPRIVTERPAGNEASLGGGQRIGSKQGFQKSRAFKSEREGWNEGYKYETSIEKRLVSGIDHLYKAIADKRLRDNPELGGRTRKQVEADLSEYYSEELGAGTMDQKKLDRIVDGVMANGQVFQPGFQGRTYEADIAKQLNRSFPSNEGQIRSFITNGNHLVKAVRLGFDLGVPLIQGLPTMFKNPVLWSRAVFSSMKAMADPAVFPDYVRKNEQAVRELAENGSPVGILPEMLAGMNKGEILSKIPVVAPAQKAFARQFQTFMDVAKIELWKSVREVTPKSEWNQAIQTIEAQLMSARMESIGIGKNQAFTERVAFLAPSYYRGAVNLVAQMAKPGVTGGMARRAIGAYLAGGIATYIAASISAGMDEEEIKSRLNPNSPNFLQVAYKRDDGRIINTGFGGVYRSLLKLAGGIVKTSIDEPENWKALDPQRNPITRWLRGHASPVPAMAFDALSGRDFVGRSVDIPSSAESVLPMWMSPYVGKTEKVPPTITETALGFGGLNGFSQTPHQYIKSKAGQFKYDHLGPQPRWQPEESPYSRLEWALRLNRADAAKKEYTDLLKKLRPGLDQEPEQMVRKHFKALKDNTTFTGDSKLEKEFKASLTPQQSELYENARDEQKDLNNRFKAMLDSL